MNETILNGLLNLFAIFASLAKIESDQARQADEILGFKITDIMFAGTDDQFEKETGLSFDNLLGNSLDLLSAK